MMSHIDKTPYIYGDFSWLFTKDFYIVLFYFILFCAIGFILGLFFTVKGATNVILIVTIGWAFVQGPWALATLGELLLGFGAGRVAYKALRNEN